MPNASESRGYASNGAILVANQRRAASELRAFHLQMRRMGAKGPVLPSQKERAQELFKRLESINGPMREKGIEVSREMEKPEAAYEAKKIALALYLKEFLANAHRNALKGDVAGDFALFLSTFKSALDFLDRGYFSKPLLQIGLEFIILKASLDACAEACKIASLDFNPAIAKHSHDTLHFVKGVKQEGKISA